MTKNEDQGNDPYYYSSIEFVGVQICVYRSKVDRALVIQVETHDCSGEDVWPRTMVPKLKLVINDHADYLSEDGTWVPEDLWEDYCQVEKS